MGQDVNDAMKRWKNAAAILLAIVLLASACLFAVQTARRSKEATSTIFVMDTAVSQRVYGANGQEAIEAAEQSLRELEALFSLYRPESDIAHLAASAGSGEAVPIDARTYALLLDAKTLCAQTDGAFRLTIAPLALSWGIATDAPRVPSQPEIDRLLLLVNDDDLILQDGTAYLQQAGQAVDLGGVAKGAACDAIRELYDAYGIRSALCWVGGSSIYARGEKPDGTGWRLGFRDPSEEEAATSLASFEIRDAVFCTSGGYERYFEEDGVRYHHILDPATGYPVQTDILSVGVLSESGTEADLWSTALFVQGTEKALEYFANGGEGILLDDACHLYVSRALQSSFELTVQDAGRYQVIFLP